MSRPPAVRAVAVTPTCTYVDGVEYATVFRGPVPDLALLTLVRRAAARAEDAGAVLVIEEAAAGLLGLDGPSGARTMAAFDALAAAGWTHATPGHWTSLWHSGVKSKAGARRLYLCVPHWARPTDEQYLIDAGDLAGTTRRLALYHDRVGAPFLRSPHTSAMVALRHQPQRRCQPYYKPDLTRLAAPVRLGEVQRVWTAPEAGKQAHRHRYDLWSAYLAAAALVPVAVGALEHTGSSWDKTRAGYWLITPPPWQHPAMPSPVECQKPDRGRYWVCTPTLALFEELAEHGWCDAPQLHDSWTAAGSRSVLRSWAESIRDALIELDTTTDPDSAAVRDVLKESYKRGHGMLDSPISSIYRPDWHHAIVAQSWASLWRKIWAIGMTEGRWPEHIDVDCITYPSPEPDPATAAPRGLDLGTGFGKFRVYSRELVTA